MGIKLANLATTMARVLEYPEATAAVIARFGRDEGLLTTGARGRHVPDATDLDAARLLIGMMLTESPARAAGFIKDFGELQVLRDITWYEGDAEELALELFPAEQAFDVSIARLLSAMGDPSFAAQARSVARLRGHLPEDPTIMFPIDISIDSGLFQAEIAFGEARLTFAHSSLNGPRDQLSYAAAEEAGRPYRRAIKSTFRIEVDVLEYIAAVLHGTRFSTLLDAPAETEAQAEVA